MPAVEMIGGHGFGGEAQEYVRKGFGVPGRHPTSITWDKRGRVPMPWSAPAGCHWQRPIDHWGRRGGSIPAQLSPACSPPKPNTKESRANPDCGRALPAFPRRPDRKIHRTCEPPIAVAAMFPTRIACCAIRAARVRNRRNKE